MFACSSPKRPSVDACEFGQIANEEFQVQLDRLVNSADKFHHQNVVVTGFFSRKFEDSSLWSSSVAAEQRAIGTPHLIVVEAPPFRAHAAACSNMPIKVAGEVIDERREFGAPVIIPHAVRVIR